jgi:hypothetical protein
MLLPTSRTCVHSCSRLRQVHISVLALLAGASAIVSAGVHRVPIRPEADRAWLAGGGECAAAAGDAGAGTAGRCKKQLRVCWQAAAVLEQVSIVVQLWAMPVDTGYVLWSAICEVLAA